MRFFSSFLFRASFGNLIMQGDGLQVDGRPLLPCGGAETTEDRGRGGGGGGEANLASNRAAQEEELPHGHGLLRSTWWRLQYIFSVSYEDAASYAVANFGASRPLSLHREQGGAGGSISPFKI